MFKYFLSPLLLITLSFPTFADGKLIFAIDLIRHGDRTPLIVSPGMEKLYPQGLGQLTPKGMQQEYEVGKSLRKRYVDEYALLPKDYDIQTMLVRSSGMPRTLMSAQSILFGLYPLGTGPKLADGAEALPKGLQPIPINTVPTKQDSLLIPGRDLDAFQKNILNSQEWSQKNQDLNSNYARWSKVFGTPINNLFDLIHLSDRLYIESIYNISPPDGVDDAELAVIMDAGKWAWLYVANNPKLAEIGGRELADMIKGEMLIAQHKTRPLKYMLLVAHDTTIQAQLKLLHQTIEYLPPYVAQLSYLLFDMGSSYEVRVTYNQKPLYIDACGGTSCTLEKFSGLGV